MQKIRASRVTIRGYTCAHLLGYICAFPWISMRSCSGPCTCAAVVLCVCVCVCGGGSGAHIIITSDLQSLFCSPALALTLAFAGVRLMYILCCQDPPLYDSHFSDHHERRRGCDVTPGIQHHRSHTTQAICNVTLCQTCYTYLAQHHHSHTTPAICNVTLC